MFAATLSLALGVLSPALPVAAVTSGAAVAVCFSPEEDCAALAVDAIDRAESQILANAYALTIGSGIVEALVRAKHRGVDVKLIADRTTPCERGKRDRAVSSCRGADMDRSRREDRSRQSDDDRP